MNPLDKIVAEVNKKYGEGTILRADEAKSLVTERIPTGVFDFDMRIGGGFPRGRITVIKGEYSTGKSVLCLLAAANAQRHCRHCGCAFEYVDLLGEVHELDCKCGKKNPMRVVILDAEHSFDADWAAKWGLDVSETYVIQTEYAEQAIDVADACIRSRECDFLLVDSVAALTPSVEVEESAEKWQIGVFARLMNKAMRKWTSAINSYGMQSEEMCTIVLINQLRMSLGGYRPTTTSPGGKGIDFFESVEVRLKRVGEVTAKGTDRPLGIEVEYVIKKNKTAPLMPGGLFKLFFVGERGGYQIGDTDNDVQVLRLASYWNLIEKGGSWYTFPDGQKVQGDEKAAAVLRQDPKLMLRFQEMIRERELSWANEAQDLSDGKDTKAARAKKAEAEDVE